MPQIDPASPTATHKFAGHDITVHYPYAEAHVLTAAEAKYLNRTLATTIGNAFASAIRREVDTYNAANPKKPITADTLAWDWQAKFDEMFAAYEPGVSNRSSGTGRTSGDPIAKAAHSIAAAKVKELLASKGKNIRQFMSTKAPNSEVTMFNTLVAQYIERNAWVNELAASQVAAMQSASDDLELPADPQSIAAE